MVEQMLSNMKKTAASSCSKAKVTLRPKTFSRPMFNGTTGRKQVCSLWSMSYDTSDHICADAACFSNSLQVAAQRHLQSLKRLPQKSG